MRRFLLFAFAVLHFKGTVYGLENDLLDFSNPQAQEITKDKNNTKELPYKSLQKKLKNFIDLDKDVTNLTMWQINSLIWWMQQALTSLKEHQSKVYNKAVLTTNCTMPPAPSNGGLVCAYFDSVFYCKPMCDQGYDFSFLRRSRLYETCGQQTGYTWTTQYIGGKRLAECIASDTAISGQSSAYFRNKKTCQEILSLGTEETYIDQFIKELKENDITKNHKRDLDIFVCG
ncbi:uncharacterized protein RB166_018859 [Leptodactylus fuscus]|uniref:uncharacterized protein LOC142183078 n=1 Tax=Leptodactylus fuscus TaxID=238119 RepID=UPI003F4F0A15